MNGARGVSALLHVAVEVERELEVVLMHVIMLSPKTLSKLKTVAWMSVLKVQCHHTV